MATREVTVSLPYLTAAQAEIVSHPARFKVLDCGRRWGKTLLSQDVLINACLSTSLPYAYFSLSYKNMKELWEAIKTRANPVIARLSEQDKTMRLVTGSQLECWSLDTPRNTRGRKYAGMVIDESAWIPDLQSVWEEVLRPMLVDYIGWAYIMSSPNGHNYFWQLWQRGQDPQAFPEWQSWKKPITDNPYLSLQEVESIRLETPERSFQQEYMAEFLEGEGAVFRRIRDCATTPHVTPSDDGYYVAGIDWAQSQDYTVAIVLDRNTKRMVDMLRLNKADWQYQRDQIKALYAKWKLKYIMCELNSIGSPNFEALSRDGLPVFGFTTTAQSKSPLIESLVLAFEQGEIAIQDNAVLIGELEAYERKVSATTGRSQYSAPAGMHDDTVMALALAWHAVTTFSGSWIH